LLRAATTHGVVYEYVNGARRDGHAPAVRRALAHALADLDGVLCDVAPTGLPLAPTRGVTLWPPPHRASLDFVPTLAAAARIDDRGRQAQAAICAAALPVRPAHLDWGVKNARFEGDRIVAVYDWDSLAAASEAETVGRAAAQFTAQWDAPARLTPTLDEAAAFVAEYEAARGRRFSRVERAVIAASADYLVAQVARLELAGGAAPGNNYLECLATTDWRSLA
jgi:hypothetical protein